jgi:BirA family transcriptional regulator, biotin operon repressor / biotin---[acetyl-CoA-carboxylase] ligase
MVASGPVRSEAMGPYSDLDRPPLHEGRLRQALVVPGGLWTGLTVVAETASTNADLAAAARAGAPEGTVLVAERQTGGRGRLGRQWLSPPRAGLTFSVLLRPPATTGWLPLLAGVALVEAVRRLGEVDAVLKWPNDVLVGDAKCAGILAEAVPNGDAPGVVVGIGLNVTLRTPELPVPQATSLQLAGAACTDRDPLLRAVLRGLAGWYTRWRDDPAGSGLAQAYGLHCATLGRDVRVELPGGRTLHGRAEDVDADARLVVVDETGGRTAVAAGDVLHLR